MHRPKNTDEFLDLLDQAIFEVEDLVTAAGEEGEEDELGRYLPVYQQLLAELQALHAAIDGGRHQFADGSDLKVFTLAARWKARLPVYALIETVNAAHRRGLPSHGG